MPATSTAIGGAITSMLEGKSTDGHIDIEVTASSRHGSQEVD
jgi:hypothetical protein